MASNYTTNYQLNQWAKSDRVLMEDFNSDNQKIDAAIKAVAEGGVKLAIGAYVGDGQFGATHQNSLTFEFAPKWIIIMGQKSSPNALILIAAAQTAYFPMDSRSVQVTWNGKTVSWYQINNGADFQMNQSEVTYSYFAIG